MTTPLTKSNFALFFALTALAVLVATSTSSAAVTIGQSCAATGGGPTVAFQRSVSSGNGYKSPIDGVVTRWGVNRTSTSGNYSMAMITGTEPNPGNMLVSTMTPLIYLPEFAVTEQDSRFAIKAGESIGLMALPPTSISLCGGSSPSDLIAYGPGFTLPQNSFASSDANPYRIPVFATVEADVDKDGYGDETQDKCPQSAALQNPCPVLAISQQLAAAKGAIAITAAASVDTSLTATAKVKVPKLGSKKAATVTFSSKATAFSAGQIKSIKLKLPSRVKDALAATKKSKKLKFTVTLTGNGLANTASSVKSISLPGTLK